MSDWQKPMSENGMSSGGQLFMSRESYITMQMDLHPELAREDIERQLDEATASEERLARAAELREEFANRGKGGACGNCETKTYAVMDHALTLQENDDAFVERRRALLADGWTECAYNAGYIRQCKPCSDARPFTWMRDIEINAFADYLDAHPHAFELNEMRCLLRYRHRYLPKGSGYIMPDGVMVCSPQDHPEWPELPEPFTVIGARDIKPGRQLGPHGVADFLQVLKKAYDSAVAPLPDDFEPPPKGGFEFL